MHYQAAQKTAVHAEPLAWIKALTVAFRWWGTLWNFFSLLTVAWYHCHDSGLDASQLCAAPWVCDLPGNTSAALLQEQPWWLHSLNSTGWPCDSTWCCGNGRETESRVQTVCIQIFVVEQRVWKLLLSPYLHLPLKWTAFVTLLLFNPYHDLGHLPEPSFWLYKKVWSYVNS